MLVGLFGYAELDSWVWVFVLLVYAAENYLFQKASIDVWFINSWLMREPILFLFWFFREILVSETSLTWRAFSDRMLIRGFLLPQFFLEIFLAWSCLDLKFLWGWPFNLLDFAFKLSFVTFFLYSLYEAFPSAAAVNGSSFTLELTIVLLGTLWAFTIRFELT